MADVEGWIEKDRRFVWHAMAGYDPTASATIMVQGEGAWITDLDGNRYLDGMSGLWCVNIGYGREDLARAAYDQLRSLPYYPLTKSHLPAIQLAEKLNDWLEDEYVVFFSNSGSEANEMAFKAARQYHQETGHPNKWKFLSRYRAYHGQGLGSLAATGQAERKYRYEPLAPGFVHVEPPDRYRCSWCSDGPTCTMRCADQLERVARWELPETVAGIIMEPIITGGGVIPPPADYLMTVQQMCRQYGILLIMDEVICGFGRTGRKFGFHHYGVSPDIVTMAKGITSAYFPLAATAVRREIFEAFSSDDEYGRLRHVNTFGGHPGGCAVAMANLEAIEKEDLIGRSREQAGALREALSAIEDHPNVGEIRGRGLLFGIELVEDRESKRPADPRTVDAVIASCKERGLVIAKNGDTVAGFNNVLTLAPPLCVTSEDVAFIAGVFREVFAGSRLGGR